MSPAGVSSKAPAAAGGAGRGGSGPPPPLAVPRARFVALVLAVVVGGVLGILLLNTKINENAFVLEDLRQRQEVLDQREQRLAQEIARAESTTQLAAAASRLGLVDRSDDLEYLDLPREPAGDPDGRGGPDGPDGADGADGPDGADERDEPGRPVGG